MDCIRWIKAAAGLIIAGAVVAPLPLSAQAEPRRPGPAGIPVRFIEGVTHGFLDLHTPDGAVLGHGDLLQNAKGNGVESRLLLRFVDGSILEETTDFTQHGVFELQTYHLVQRGQAFMQDLDATLARSGRYLVRTRSHEDGTTTEYSGTLELPPDVSNGLPIVLAKNLTAHDTATVHLVAFTPKPRLIQLEIAASGVQKLRVGLHEETAVHFLLKPKLGALVGFFAKLLGKMPPDSHAWIIVDDVPAFVRFEGPMYIGPVWRLDLASPSWPR